MTKNLYCGAIGNDEAERNIHDTGRHGRGCPREHNAHGKRITE
jgi:hypothetical protein